MALTVISFLLILNLLMAFIADPYILIY